MSIKRDYIETEKALERAKVARAEYLRAHVFGLKLRAHHPIAVMAVVLLCLGMKMFFFHSPTAESDTRVLSSAALSLP